MRQVDHFIHGGAGAAGTRFADIMDPNNGGAFPPDGAATTPPSYGGNQMNEGYVVLAVLKNVSASNLAAGNFNPNYPPNGGAAAGQQGNGQQGGGKQSQDHRARVSFRGRSAIRKR